ncbi:MAG: hypothetical protein ABW019_11445 [Chitinophagaceae bacterium]
MRENKFKPLVPVLLIFIILNAFFIAGKTMLGRWGINHEVLIVGNLLLALVTFVSYSLLQRSLGSANPHSFMRAIYGGFIIKFILIAAAAFIYIMATREKVNKPAIAICMFLYLVYTFLEVSVLTRMLKEKKNA